MNKCTPPPQQDLTLQAGSLLPPTIAASRNPALRGSKIVWPGDAGYNSPDNQVPTMSSELSELVEQIRKEERKNPRPTTRAFVSTEEVIWGNERGYNILCFLCISSHLLHLRPDIITVVGSPEKETGYYANMVFW